MKNEISNKSVVSGENMTPINTAVAMTGTVTKVVNIANVNRHNLESFAGLLGVKLPAKMTHKAPTNKRYLYSDKDLVNKGMELENAAMIGTAKLHAIKDAVNSELMVETLCQYFKRTSTTIRRTEIPNTENVEFTVIKRPEMIIDESATFKRDDFKAQEAFLNRRALIIALSVGLIADNNGNKYLLAIGKKKPIIVRFQEFAPVAVIAPVTVTTK